MEGDIVSFAKQNDLLRAFVDDATSKVFGRFYESRFAVTVPSQNPIADFGFKPLGSPWSQPALSLPRTIRLKRLWPSLLPRKGYNR